MSKNPGTLHLNAFLMSVGHHEASWRLPESDPYAGWSVADDAVVADKEAGVHADAAKVRPVDHRGRFFRVDGPLNVPRSPQAYPLLVQAGSSEDGKQFAARWAEAVFTAQQTLEEARAFYSDLKNRTAALGRDPDGIKILPGIVPVIGDTEAQARELDAELERLISPEYAKRQLAARFKLDPAASCFCTTPATTRRHGGCQRRIRTPTSPWRPTSAWPGSPRARSSTPSSSPTARCRGATRDAGRRASSSRRCCSPHSR
jgi:alkanesulfonate monooxygenase SsuD/methylene tetrahydromethanopterin reductase-like flavin-dependent oxidoreductase (luciferase family)